MKGRKIPERKCIVCGESKPKKELIRVVVNKEKEIFVDKTGKANGRGAYICRNEECISLASKTKKLNKVFETEISTEIYDELKSSI